ncbi:MAG: hypothetical protein R3C56_02985 [Pirellulaceae bacterium]
MIRLVRALQFTCTRTLARLAWPARSGYGLKPLGAWLNPIQTSRRTRRRTLLKAHIALAIEQLHQRDDLSELEAHLHVTRGSYKHSTISSPRVDA